MPRSSLDVRHSALFIGPLVEALSYRWEVTFAFTVPKAAGLGFGPANALQQPKSQDFGRNVPRQTLDEFGDGNPACAESHTPEEFVLSYIGYDVC